MAGKRIMEYDELKALAKLVKTAKM